MRSGFGGEREGVSVAFWARRLVYEGRHPGGDAESYQLGSRCRPANSTSTRIPAVVLMIAHSEI